MFKSFGRTGIVGLLLAVFTFFGGFIAGGKLEVGPLLNYAIPELILPLLSTVATTILGALALYARKWFGIQLEEKDLKVLHSAAMTGVNLALERLSREAATGNLDVRAETIRQGVDWVMSKGAPDAVRRLKLEPSTVETLVRSKVAERVSGPEATKKIW